MADALTPLPTKKESNKRKREASDSQPSEDKAAVGTPTNDDGTQHHVQSPSLRKSNDEDGRGAGAQKFTVFVGNLPFTATTASVQKHFSEVRPSSVRHRTHRDEPTKSKGFAFVDFDAHDRMQACLKLLHHSRFDDGISPARKINIELSAGGGGAKSKQRKSKIRAKNRKLDEERERRLTARRKRDALHDHDGDDGPPSTSDIHPSRRLRFQVS
ncbi:MAG: hypothetical protein M1833_007003 [Piccolia ochrophora]|nr:MAG: hypothetical protein M1833_007003 [Piccolia ochrophora]